MYIGTTELILFIVGSQPKPEREPELLRKITVQAPVMTVARFYGSGSFRFQFRSATLLFWRMGQEVVP
jgi:hypothetical protein